MKTTWWPGTRDDFAPGISIAVGLFIVATIVAFPLLSTHYVTQDDSQIALLGWREVAKSAFPSARISGRFYFLFSWWFGWLPYAVDNFTYFKTVQMLGLLGNFLALYYLAWKVARSRSFALLTLLIALATTQARWEHNLVAAFPWAFSTSLTLMMIALGLFVDYLDGGNKRKQLLSGCLFFLSLLTYESFLFYSLAFAVLAWPRRQGIARGLAATLRATWPHICLGALYLAAYLGFRIAFPTQYGGNQMQFSPSAMFKVWMTFGRSALPATAYVDLAGVLNEFSDAYAGYVGGPLAAFKQIRVEWVILCTVAALLCVLLLSRAATEPQEMRLGRTAILGLVMAGVPQIPHALSSQYQAWVALGVKSHVPTYLAAFGVTLLLACAVTATAKAVRGAWPWTCCVAAGLAYVALLTAFSNFYVAKSQTVARRKWDLVDAVLRSEQFAALPDDAVVLAPSLWHGVNIMQVVEDYWTRYVHKKTGRHIKILRTLPAFRAACDHGCEGRAFFAKYAREGHEENQYIVLAPIEGDPENGLSARFVDGFVLSENHWFALFAGLRGETTSTVTVDSLPVTDSAKGSVWIRLDRRGEHTAPFTFHVSSQPSHLDPDSVVLSDYVDGDRFVDSVQPIFGDGFFGEESVGSERWHWAEEQATLILQNESSLPSHVTVSFLVFGSAPSCHVTIEQAGARPFTADRFPAERRLDARIGAWQDSEIHFRSDCPRAPGDPRNLRFNLRSFHLTAEPVSGGRP